MNFSYRTLFRTVTDQKMDEMVVNGDELGLCKDSFMVSQPSLCFRKRAFYLLQRQGRPLTHRVVLPLPTELEL